MLSRDVLIGKLQFAGVPPEKQQWVNRWIQIADDEKIKQFLYTLTGASSIGGDAIKISDNSQGENAPLYFHTCFNLVDIPFANIATEQDFKTVFESSLGGTKKYNRG